MGVKHDGMYLIPPQFSAPLPDLQPAVFPPNLKEFPFPPLELYDLDDQFASEKIRLSQLTNKCDDADLDYFIREAGDILGVSKEIESLNFGMGSDPKAILYHILAEIVQCKKSS
jgi:intraflagellar transport protein 52